jgi:hypothetical protein
MAQSRRERKLDKHHADVRFALCWFMRGFAALGKSGGSCSFLNENMIHEHQLSHISGCLSKMPKQYAISIIEVYTYIRRWLIIYIVFYGESVAERVNEQFGRLIYQLGIHTAPCYEE